MRYSSSHTNWLAAAALLVAAFVAGPAWAETSPTTQVSTSGTLNMSAGLSHGYLPTNTAKNVHARIQVDASDIRTDGRAPLNLAVVIDHSGSMSGGRLTQAKRAARQLVDRLSEGDRLAVVGYGSRVSVRSPSRHATPNNRRRIKRSISAIRRQGGTFLAGGFRKAKQIVDRHATEETVDRVILLSDGKANHGIKSARGLGRLAEGAMETGVTTTTMGIGLNYNESVMTSMAEMGSGNHYFIEDENKIAATFSQEFQNLSNVVARDAYVVLELGNNVELLDVHGFSHRRRSGNVVVSLGSFYAGQNKDILVDLAASSSGAGPRDMVDINLHFDDVTGESDESVTATASLSAVATSDTDKHADLNKSVMRRVEQVTYADNVRKAREAYDRGERERARGIIDKQRQRLETRGDDVGFSGAKIQQKSRELEEKKRKMQAAPSSAEGKRMKKEDASESLDVMRSGSAF